MKSPIANSKGFTLIELLVVIGIIGTLSTLAVFGLNSARSKSRDSRRVTDVKQIQTALELYYADRNGYPTTSGPIILGASGLTALCDTGFDASCAGATYMARVPLAQVPLDGSCTADENNFTYESSVEAEYTLSFCLGGRVGGLSQGIHTADPNGIQ
jgi:prepilin-type N-terminal cleavage/methylation domain-containing protein